MPRKTVAPKVLYWRTAVVTLNVINVATRVVDGDGRRARGASLACLKQMCTTQQYAA